MKKLVVAAVVALVVIGIVKLVSANSTEKRAHAACENIAEKCDGLVKLGGNKLSQKDIDECTKDIAGAAKELGDSYEPMVSCMADANTCGEALGCMGGAVFNEIGEQLGKELEGLGRGFSRMNK